MTQDDVERIAAHALRELGAAGPFTVAPDDQPDRWRITLADGHPGQLKIRAGQGTSAQHVRAQIFEQFQER
ncbi:MAG TPA: hypothetical protein VG871_16635 [Vicinamibacterales bacterium]|nr:hypothetical protein [Vicinamibacterales bacterium]